MDNPVISIIIPVYNTARYLDKCLASVCGQVFEDIEVVLVNDGSTDDSPAICNQWAKKDSRIKVIHTPNQGVAEARNVGLKNVTGKYIGFVDSDDWIEPDMFEVLYNSIKKNNADISVCGAFIDDEAGKLKWIDLHQNEEAIWEGIEALKRLMMDYSIKNYNDYPQLFLL